MASSSLRPRLSVIPCGGDAPASRHRVDGAASVARPSRAPVPFSSSSSFAGPVSTNPPVSSGAQLASNAPRVLIIDDDEMVRKALTRALRRRYAVTEQRDAESALLMIQSGVRFDAILCDLHLNGMSGRELVLELDDTIPEQAKRVILMSGTGREAMDEELQLVVQSRFIEKPASFAQIEAAVATLMRDEEARAA